MHMCHVTNIGLTRSMDDFDYLAPALADCRMIRMDYRGRGQSAWTGAATYTVPQEGADALALLDHLGIARAARCCGRSIARRRSG